MTFSRTDQTAAAAAANSRAREAAAGGPLSARLALALAGSGRYADPVALAGQLNVTLPALRAAAEELAGLRPNTGGIRLVGSDRLRLLRLLLTC